MKIIRIKFNLNVLHKRDARRTFFTETLINLGPSFQHTIQSSIYQLHTISGLPWWATFATSTVIVRALLIPLVGQQYIENSKLGQCMGDVRELRRAYKIRIKYDKSSAPMTSLINGTRASMTHHNVKLFRIFGLPITNIGVFFTFVYSIRNIINENSQELMPFFPDFYMTDPSIILACISLGFTYTTLEVSLRILGKFGIFYKDLFQSVVILFLPLTSTLSSGVFCYWIPSSILSICQILYMQTGKNAKLNMYHLAISNWSSWGSNIWAWLKSRSKL